MVAGAISTCDNCVDIRRKSVGYAGYDPEVLESFDNTGTACTRHSHKPGETNHHCQNREQGRVGLPGHVAFRHGCRGDIFEIPFYQDCQVQQAYPKTIIFILKLNLNET